MLAEERFAVIQELLHKKRAATVTELARALNTSESTIRRDLILLAGQGKLNKLHGGAVAREDTFDAGEETMSAKEQQNVAEKQAIARYAARQIQPDDVVFLDAGSTTLMMLDFLQPGGAVFITNGVMHAQKLVQKGFRAFVPGGMLKPGTEAIVGAAAVQSLSRYNFTKAFLGVNGIALSQGYTTPDPEEALVKSTAMTQAYVSYVLADSSKFGRVSAVSIAPLDRACILTDRLPDKTYAKHAIVKEVEPDQ